MMKDRMVPIHMGLPRSIYQWVEETAERERRKPNEVLRNIVLERYENEHGAKAKPNGAADAKHQAKRA